MKAIKITTRHLGRVGLLGIAFAAASVVFAAALVVRLLFGPISLGPFNNELRGSLDAALPGLAVRFDNAALAWSRDENRIDLVILGARVFDENQHIIAQAPQAEIGLALKPLLHGKIVVQRIALVGVQLTLVHGKDGILRLGIEGAQNQSDVLQKIRDVIAKSGTGTSSLASFAIDRARLAFYEEETGVFVVAPNANLKVTRSDGKLGPKGSIRADVDAAIEISGRPARVKAVFNLPQSNNDVTGDISIRGLKIRSLAINTKFFSFLDPFDLAADISASFTLSNGTRVRAADFGIGAAGTVNGLGKPVHVRTLKIAGRYDGATGRLLIDDATLEGTQARAHLQGQGDLSFSPSGALTKAALELRMDKFAIDMPGVMGRSVSIAQAEIRGSYDPAANQIAIDQAFVFGGPLSAKFTGRVLLADNQSPEIDVDGNIAAISVRDLMRYWPLQAGPGARSWIDANVSAGRLGPVVLHTHIPAGAFEKPAFPDDAVTMTFPVAGVAVSYVRGLTPLTGATGTCTLTGDTFRAQLTSGSVGSLNVSNGSVLIPDLHVHGTQGVVSAHVDGAVTDVLALIDQKPLQYPSRFKIRSATAKGKATADLTFRVPMLHDLRVDNIGISIRAAATGLGLALNDRLIVSNGNVNFLIDNSSLHATGTVSLVGANLGVDWTEAFRPAGPISTRVKVNGVLPESSLEDLGVRASDFLSGTVGIAGELDGLRGSIQSAQLVVDATNAAVDLDLLGYEKAVGTQADARLNLGFDPNGSVRTADITVTGDALSAHGTMQFDGSQSLQSLAVPVFRSGEFDDFALAMTRDPTLGITVSLSGRSFDSQTLLHHGAAQAKKSSDRPTGPPQLYHIAAKLDRVAMHQGVVLTGVSLNFSSAGRRLKTLSLNATLSKTAQLTGGMSVAADGGHIKLTAGDAGLFLQGLFGSTSLKGGTLEIDALVPNPTQSSKADSADYAGKISMGDFTVVNQPFLTRLFAAGSFGGLADLLRGQGIEVDTLEVPFSLKGGVMTVRDARASGPSLGLTADGYYELDTNQLALQGALTPLYGINGIVGSIPVLGSVLGSKKGEGFIGVTYSASGPADAPAVSVNPLSVLTPGILRRIFQGRTPTAPPPPQADTNPQARKSQ